MSRRGDAEAQRDDWAATFSIRGLEGSRWRLRRARSMGRECCFSDPGGRVQCYEYPNDDGEVTGRVQSFCSSREKNGGKKLLRQCWKTRVQRRAAAHRWALGDLLGYEESKKLHRDSSSAENRRIRLIRAPQRGHCQSPV